MLFSKFVPDDVWESSTRRCIYNVKCFIEKKRIYSSILRLALSRGSDSGASTMCYKLVKEGKQSEIQNNFTQMYCRLKSSQRNFHKPLPPTFTVYTFIFYTEQIFNSLVLTTWLKTVLTGTLDPALVLSLQPPLSYSAPKRRSASQPAAKRAAAGREAGR